ncbi:MAG TPA: PEP-CTERM sorting domain-containing protein, partial [Planctomycetota bacterium]|nr:PEP-CTERM sorting domain-containing protein [Planctomycetota bacterium]
QGTDRLNTSIQGYFFGVEVKGTDIANGVFVCVDTGKWGALSYDGTDSWDNDQGFASMASLLAAHPADPTTQYRLYFNRTVPNPKPDNFAHWEDVVYLGFSATAPTGYATISYPLHGATGVEVDPNYAWDNVQGKGKVLGLFVRNNDTDVELFRELDNDMTRTSWQPGALSQDQTYRTTVAVAKLVGGAGKPLNLTMLSGDPFDYYGVFADSNENEFTTVPEPSTVALVGTGVLVCIAVRRRRRMH